MCFNYFLIHCKVIFLLISKQINSRISVMFTVSSLLHFVLILIPKGTVCTNGNLKTLHMVGYAVAFTGSVVNSLISYVRYFICFTCTVVCKK